MLRSILILVIAVFSFAAPCSSSYASGFTLLFSNDMRGEIEPCG